MDRNELKVQSMKERYAKMVGNYEEEIAELRVEYTLLAQRFEEMQQQLDEMTRRELNEVPADVTYDEEESVTPDED